MPLILRTKQSIEKGDYTFSFSIDQESISTNDRQALAKFGEPLIDLGGAIVSGQISYTLPNKFVKLISGLPVKVQFSEVAPFDTDTDNKLTAYRTVVQQRFVDAIETLRTTADTFTGEYVTNI